MTERLRAAVGETRKLEDDRQLVAIMTNSSPE
jgi:hypothetical protein